jgi:molybdopterin-guanine dinucleotide biosynthesis protein A
MNITVAILAGGRSRRMGADKAEMMWNGLSLLERMTREAQKANLPVLIIGHEKPADWPVPETMFAADDWPGRGPLGGLLTALRHAEGSSILLTACDMPALSAEALSWLARQAPQTHGAAIVNAAQLEPLFSLYAPACRDAAGPQMRAGRLSLHGLIEGGQFQKIEAPAWLRPQLVNINTPEEWAQWTANAEEAQPHP